MNKNIGFIRNIRKKCASLLHVFLVVLNLVSCISVNTLYATTLNTDHLSSDEEIQITSYDGDTFRFILEYERNASEGTENQEDIILCVEEIKESDENYEIYTNRVTDLTENTLSLYRFYSLSLKDADGNAFIPEKQTFMTVEKISDADNTDSSYEDTRIFLLYDKDRELDSRKTGVAFNDKDELIIALANIPKEKKEESEHIYSHTLAKEFVTSADDRYRITLSYGDDALIPEGSSLLVSEVTGKDSRYDEYTEKTVETLEWESDYFSMMFFFDIDIMYKEEKITPASTVDIRVELIKENNDELIEIDDTQLIALKDEDQLIEDSHFEVDYTGEESNPVLSVVQIVKEKQIIASDDKTYNIRVTYNSDSGLPLNALLDVKEVLIGEENYDTYLSETESVLETKDISYIRVFDISIIDPETGEKYEPDSNVSVSIELMDTSIKSEDEINVIHIKENINEIEPENEDDEPIIEITYETSLVEQRSMLKTTLSNLKQTASRSTL